MGVYLSAFHPAHTPLVEGFILKSLVSKLLGLELALMKRRECGLE